MNATTTVREHRNDRQIINKENPTGDIRKGSKGVNEIFFLYPTRNKRMIYMTWITLNDPDMASIAC